jgi:hypothetical protein
MVEHADAGRARVSELLGPGPRAITRAILGDKVEVELFASSALDTAQIGYSRTADGDSLVGGGGSWQAEWFVIGCDAELGDPVFVDLSLPELPVLSAMHGMGVWEPFQIAESLERLLESDVD